MLDLQLDRILFLDIETVPQVSHYEELSDELARLWDEKTQVLQAKNPERYPPDWTPQEAFLNGAGIYAEFGKVICVSIGFIHFQNGEMAFRTKSFSGNDEKILLSEFSSMLVKNFSTYHLCGHNIKEFDIPYLCRRMLLNGLPLPPMLRIAGKKPWEVQFIDTLEFWKFGDFKNYTSLKLLTTIFGIPTSKDDIDGSQVAKVYYQEKNLSRIVTYCEKDVVATAQLLLRMLGKEIIPIERISTGN